MKALCTDDVHVTLREFNTGRLRFSYFRTTEQNRHCFVQFANQKFKSHLLYATDKAEQLKNSKASIESVFYEWLLAELPEEEKAAFLETLDKLYWRSKEQRRAEFKDVSQLVEPGENEESETDGETDA